MIDTPIITTRRSSGTDKNSDKFLQLNVGPSHPATHGTLRILVKLEGEMIRDMKLEIGYLHRCFEKMAETHSWNQVIPFTDRLNYVSAMMNNVGYVMAVEKLLGIQVTKRCQRIRVIVAELSRIIDHLVCIGANAVDLGALTCFWYFFRERENIYDLFEAACGARLTTSYTRVGGLLADLPEGWTSWCRKVIDNLPRTLDDVEGLLTGNRIWIDRTRGIGVISQERAIDYGFTGPCLRATGNAYDVRKAHPYYDYDQFDFKVITENAGDTYARYLVRMAEMRESIKIIRQALDNLPEGDVNVNDWAITLPPKEQVYNSIEGLMAHFKLIMHGIRPPKGEVYSYSEAANGELGFFVCSDEQGRPYRVRVRPPCFAIYQAFPEMCIGQTVSDAVATLGSLNIVAGELDR
ncbi:MAG: NADH dehydrogenase (quinone) subunit D [Proteobacteria bacterium]|nr:NADH dehydrogenase (quinone) subunit D [Pseudomonadota bacterium]NDC24201.1 NADH dehydrogenase (quinone) subunit D [Pseudomonadota bacterium]NDD04565.1 NADH dehydrogenase (quinone) subunit D [Pseudomonadota bacterium]NDG26872.1 NADH dehydrogenase (quinone) subunit D [Pseudomonadota bacterium]